MSTGGGGAAGTMTPPDYIKAFHTNILNDSALDGTGGTSLGSSFADIYNSLSSDMISILEGNVGELGSADYFTAGAGWSYDDANDEWIHTAGNDENLVLDSKYINLTEGEMYYVTVTHNDCTNAASCVIVLGDGSDSLELSYDESSASAFLVAGSDDSVIFAPNSQYDGDIASFDVFNLSGGNPYSDLTAYDPSTVLSDMEANMGEMLAMTNNIHPTTEWETYNDKASSDISTTMQNVDTELDAAVSSVIDALNGTDKILDKVESAATTKTNSHLSSTITNSISDVKDIIVEQVVTALSGAKNNMDAIQDETNDNIDIVVDNAISKMKSEIDSIISSGNTVTANNVSTVITSAINKASEAINGAPISDMVDSYENRRTNSFMKSVNRFTGGMADVNAVNSSAFVMGLAILESENQADINKYDAELSMDVYKDTLTSYLSVFNKMLTDYIQTQVGSVFQYLQTQNSMAGLYSDEISKNLSAQIQTWRDTFEGYNDAFRTMLTEYLRSHMTGLSNYRDFSRIKLGSMQGANSLMSSMDKHKKALFESYYLNKHKYHALKLATKKEEEQRNVELDYLDATWDLSLFQIGGSLLASGVGGAGYVPNRPLTGASAASGAVSGAAMGAKVGTMVGPEGTAAGALIGTVVGGVGGYLGGGGEF